MRKDELKSSPISEAEIVAETRVVRAHEDHGNGLNLHDFLYILFSHKWKIMIFAAAGLIAAACVFLLSAPLYQSQAKLLIRYVIDSHTMDQLDSEVTLGSNRAMEAVINAEIEILTSWDLSNQVAQVVDRKALVPGADEEVTDVEASMAVREGLNATAMKGSNVLWVSYQHSDPGLCVAVLRELVQKFFDKHLEIHRSSEGFAIIDRELSNVREVLRQTDVALDALMESAKITSLADTREALSSQKMKVSEDLIVAMADLAERRAHLDVLKSLESRENLPDSPADPEPIEPPMDLPTKSDIAEYSALLRTLALLEDQKLDLLGRFTPQSESVKLTQTRIDAAEVERRALLEQFPSLDEVAGPMSDPALQGAGYDPRQDAAQIAAQIPAIEARINFLTAENEAIDKRSIEVAKVGSEIAALEREKGAAEERMQRLRSALEKVKIDGALDPSKTGMPNISVLQEPSVPIRVAAESFKKLVLALAIGGLALGVGLAFVIEMFLDRSVKRPREFKTRLRFPLMLSIPYLNGMNGGAQLAFPQGEPEDAMGEPKSSRKSRKKSAGVAPSPWDAEHFIRPFSDAVRDRLLYNFEVRRMTHKPKLVAVTGFSDGAGTSTLAAGLASSFAETGDCKVLYMNLNTGADSSGSAPGFNSDALIGEVETSNGFGLQEQQENLFIARVGSGNGDGRAKQFIPKKLYDLMPRFRSSEFDYVIFDMPPLGPTSPTLAMAGFMDKVLMVIDAGKTNSDDIRHGYEELVANHADVSAILNKTRETFPTWLQG